MADKAGDTFVSKGIEFVLQPGTNGKLRPYTVGPVATTLIKYSSKLGWIGLAITATVVVGASVYYMCQGKKSSQK
jgi:hypothetical protein